MLNTSIKYQQKMFIFLLFSSYLFLFNFYPFQFTSYPHFFFLFWRASPAKWHINFLTQNKYLNIKEVSKLFQDKNDWCSYSPDLCNALTAAAMLGKQKVNRVLLFLLNKFFCGLSLNIWNGGYISGLRIRIRSVFLGSGSGSGMIIPTNIKTNF